MLPASGSARADRTPAGVTASVMDSTAGVPRSSSAFGRSPTAGSLQPCAAPVRSKSPRAGLNSADRRTRARSLGGAGRRRVDRGVAGEGAGVGLAQRMGEAARLAGPQAQRHQAL